MNEKLEQYVAFFGKDSHPIGLPTLVEDDTDISAACECSPAGTCYHGVYSKSQLLKLGFVESDFEVD